MFFFCFCKKIWIAPFVKSFSQKKSSQNTLFIWKNRFFANKREAWNHLFFRKIDFLSRHSKHPYILATNLSVLHNLNKSTKLFSNLCQAKVLDTLTKLFFSCRKFFKILTPFFDIVEEKSNKNYSRLYSSLQSVAVFITTTCHPILS